jgi:hypothetical protein
MSDDALLDQAAQLIADARVASLKLGIPPEEITNEAPPQTDEVYQLARVV